MRASQDRVTIRAVRASDVPAMLDYFAGLSEASRAFFHPFPFDEEHARLMCQPNERSRRLVAVVAGRIVGLAWFDERPSGLPMVGIGIIDACHGRGIGRKLMGALHEEARRRGLAGLELTVYKTNHRAIALYHSLGYEIFGEKGPEHRMRVLFGEPNPAP